VPLDVGGRIAAITGTLYWVGQDDSLPLLPFVGLGVFTFVCAVVVVRRRRRAAADGEPKERESW
jgi:hypothetical protein